MKAHRSLLFLVMLPFLAQAQQARQFTVSNPYPFTDCTYKVTAKVQVVDKRGSIALDLDPVSEVVKPGDSKMLAVEIPTGHAVYNVQFSAIAHESGITHRQLGDVFEVRDLGCLTEKNARTFWKPLGENNYHIWEAIVTEEAEEVVIKDEGDGEPEKP